MNSNNLREIINLIDKLHFRTSKEKHEMSHLYESKIQNMGNAGRNGGEYYTPRPLITTIVKVVAPEIGNKIGNWNFFGINNIYQVYVEVDTIFRILHLLGI